MGIGVFVEASAHPVLAMPLSTASGERGGWWSVRCVARPAGCRSCCATEHAALPWCCGRVGEGAGGRRQKRVVALPTYAFQRQRYWLEAGKASGDVTTMGQSVSRPPAVGSSDAVGGQRTVPVDGSIVGVGTGWLRDHAVFGTVLVPGTGLLELGFAAARAVGSTTVSQLTLVTPLVLPSDGAVRVQVQVDAPEEGEEGRRGLSIFSRLEDASDEASWTLHAQGTLSGPRRRLRCRKRSGSTHGRRRVGRRSI